MTHRALIASVAVGERRREDPGDIEGLAASIARYGLLHPIVLDEDGNLIAGGRRLEACKRLQWEEIPVTWLGELSEPERREIELEENLRRKDLTQYERDKILVGLAATAGEILKQQEADFSPDSGEKSRGRPRKAAAQDRVSERIGIPQSTLNDAARHVETVDTFIPTTGPDWPQYHVLEARSLLERIPEDERLKATKLIDQPGVPPKKGLAILGNLAEMPGPERARVFDLADSPDSRDQQLALTTAAALPPMPDPRLNRLESAISEIRAAARLFPGDPLNIDLTVEVERIRDLIVRIRQQRSQP